MVLRLHGIVLTGILLFALIFFSSCASGRPLPGEGSGQVDLEASAVPLFAPKPDDRFFFSFSDASILDDMETGSATSIQRAVSKLRSSSTAGQPEKIMLAIASSLMATLWPSVKVNVDVPSGIEPNPYTAAIESARMGIFDENTGNTDFFTMVLPALVLFSSQVQRDYHQKVQAALLSALEMRRDSVLVLYLLGCLYRQMEEFDSALDVVQRALSLAPESFELQYIHAELQHLLGRYEGAMAAVSALLVRHPGNAQLLKLGAQIAFAQGRYALAEEYIDQVLQQDPENPQYLLMRVRVLVEQGNYIKAVPLLDAYTRIDKTSKDYLLLRSEVQYEWNKNTAAAVATLEQALSLYPEEHDVILAAAHLSSVAGTAIGGMRAGDFAQEILGRNPENQQALFINAEDASIRRDWSVAYEYSSRLLAGEEQPPVDVGLLHVKACLGLGLAEEALALASRLNDAHPDSDEVKESYIRSLDAAGNRGEVRSLITRFLPSASPKLRSFLYYQRSLLTTRDEDKLSDLRQSLTANPRNVDALFQLYLYYFNRQDYRKAQYYLKQVVALSGSDQEILRLNAELEAIVSQ